MSADLLRRAAALMRERAEAATSGPWVAFHAADAFADAWHVDGDDGSTTVCDAGPPQLGGQRDAEHIASWHPDVALAAALGMECTAEALEVRGVTAHIKPAERAWIAVARAYLGSNADA